jgi:hypothetical protein
MFDGAIKQCIEQHELPHTGWTFQNTANTGEGYLAERGIVQCNPAHPRLPLFE